MKFLRYIIIYVSALLAVQLVVAQEKPAISSRLSADTVMIGDRVTLTIEVDADMMQHIVFPSFDFTQTEGAEQQEPSIEVINDFRSEEHTSELQSPS